MVIRSRSLSGAILPFDHFSNVIMKLLPQTVWHNWHLSVILVTVARTAYVYIWDIVMDWALAKPQSKHCLLPNHLLYGSKWPYHLAVSSNLIARCTWILSQQPTWCYAGELVLVDFSKNLLLAQSSAGCSTLFGFIEIFRRGQWLVYRVEHQQLKLRGYPALPEARPL